MKTWRPDLARRTVRFSLAAAKVKKYLKEQYLLLKNDEKDYSKVNDNRNTFERNDSILFV